MLGSPNGTPQIGQTLEVASEFPSKLLLKFPSGGGGLSYPLPKP